MLTNSSYYLRLTNCLFQLYNCFVQTVCISISIVDKQFVLPLSDKLFVSVYQFLTNSSYEFGPKTVCISLKNVYQFLTNSSYELGPKTVCISLKIQMNLSKYSVSKTKSRSRYSILISQFRWNCKIWWTFFNTSF